MNRLPPLAGLCRSLFLASCLAVACMACASSGPPSGGPLVADADADPDVGAPSFDTGPRSPDDAGAPPPADSSTTVPDAGPLPLTCLDAMDCTTCGDLAGCAYCAGTGRCIDGASSCGYGRGSGATACPSATLPCGVAECWDPSTTLSACGAAALDQDFSSGRYAVHRYFLRLEAGGPVEIRHARRGGTYSPALVITDSGGGLVHAGAPGDLHADVDVISAVDGRREGSASVTLSARVTTDLWVHVTSWAVVDSDFTSMVPTDEPTTVPTTEPTAEPSLQPTPLPIDATLEPTSEPSPVPPSAHEKSAA